MKKLAIFFIILFIQDNIYAQYKIENYPFKVEIVGKGNPIILIPGLGCSGAVWSETVQTLKDTYQCHVLSLAGFNNQKPIDLQNGFIPIIEANIIKYINTELNEKPILIGHSLGGFLALAISCSQSEILSKTIIVDSYPFIPAAFNPSATKESVIDQAILLKESILNAPDSTFHAQEISKLQTMISGEENIKTASK